MLEGDRVQSTCVRNMRGTVVRMARLRFCRERTPTAVAIVNFDKGVGRIAVWTRFLKSENVRRVGRV